MIGMLALESLRSRITISTNIFAQVSSEVRKGSVLPHSSMGIFLDPSKQGTVPDGCIFNWNDQAG